MKDNKEKELYILSLFSQLNTNLNKYVILYSELKTLFHFKEVVSDNDLSRKNDLEKSIKFSKNRISELLKIIDTFFNKGFFSEMDKETIDELNDEYLEVINYTNSIKVSLNLILSKKFPELKIISEQLIKELNNLDNNIRVYNSTAENENWSNKIIEPKEAKEYLKKLYSDVDV